MNNKKKINLTLDCEIIRNLEIDDTNIDGETVMMDIENGEYYALNEVGTRVWELTKEKIKINNIISTLLEEYDVNENKCRESIISFIERLYCNDLIKFV